MIRVRTRQVSSSKILKELKAYRHRGSRTISLLGTATTETSFGTGRTSTRSESAPLPKSRFWWTGFLAMSTRMDMMADLPETSFCNSYAYRKMAIDF